MKIIIFTESQSIMRTAKKHDINVSKYRICFVSNVKGNEISTVRLLCNWHDGTLYETAINREDFYHHSHNAFEALLFHIKTCRQVRKGI